LFINRQKRLKISENRELSAKLEHEKEVQKLEKEKQEELLDAKTREITSYSILVSNKNNLLKSIFDLNTQVLNNKGKTTEASAKIDEIIKNNLNVDEEWDNFKMHFDKVHPHFFEKLKKLDAGLTDENLKLCAYIKMGMTNKQIAQLFHVMANSIISYRYRLKKKLQIPDNESLSRFIGNL